MRGAAVKLIKIARKTVDESSSRARRFPSDLEARNRRPIAPSTLRRRRIVAASQLFRRSPGRAIAIRYYGVNAVAISQSIISIILARQTRRITTEASRRLLQVLTATDVEDERGKMNGERRDVDTAIM